MTRSKPEVWFAIPSASVERCRARLPAWRDLGYRVAVLQNQEQGEIPADRVTWSDTYPGWAASVNLLCREIVPPTAEIVVTGGDDMLPDSSLPATALAQEMFDHLRGSFGVMQPCGDGFLGARSYCGSPWLGREWIERAYGGAGPMFPGYRHNWADGELYWVARGLEALWMRDDLTQRHEHFSRAGENAPEWWSREVGSHDRADVELFLARSWQGFPGCEPVGLPNRLDHERFGREYDYRAEKHWVQRYAMSLASDEPERRLRAALDECAARGFGRVAIFGAGSHTRLGGRALMEPPVEIVCLIDDAASIAGARLWNYPVVSRDQLDLAQLDAVIISSSTIESHLTQLAEPWAAHGVEIIRLYESAPAPVEVGP